jgi:crotonobetainyl-CoA:carnitine CoA-transferase CaiB-like acyl-CoA transferase
MDAARRLVLLREREGWSMSSGPLSGFRVLDFTIIYAGPYAGLHLADLGADVIKVEQPGGDPFRHSGAVVPENSKTFQFLNRGKRGIVVDLQHEQGRTLVHRMVRDADAVIMNYRPGVSTRLGIDYETVSAIRPDLVYGEITGFGDRGPLAGLAGTNIVAEAYSGAMAISGKVDEDGAPMRSGLTVADLHAGLALAMGVTAALVHRERTGEGQYVSTSLLRAVLSLTGVHNLREPVSDAVTRDPVMAEVERLRASDGTYEEILDARGTYGTLRGGPYHGGYRVKDGAIAIGALTPANFKAARMVLGIDDDPTASADFNALDPEHRRRRDDLRAQIREQLLTRTVAEWVRDFSAAGVPVGPVQIPEEVADDEHVRTMMVEAEHELTGRQMQAGPIVEMSASPLGVERAAPPLGRHTDEVLAELGCSAEEIGALRACGAVA